MVGAKLANLQKGDNQHSSIGLSSPPVTQKQAAEMLNIGVVCQTNRRQFDFRGHEWESHFVTRAKPTMQTLADAYQLSRQGLYVALESNAMTRADLADPDYVFQRLLDLGRQSPLRRRLANPKLRAKIATKISKLSA
jgi:hypothetical protein